MIINPEVAKMSLSLSLSPFNCVKKKMRMLNDVTFNSLVCVCLLTKCLDSNFKMLLVDADEYDYNDDDDDL